MLQREAIREISLKKERSITPKQYSLEGKRENVKHTYFILYFIFAFS